MNDLEKFEKTDLSELLTKENKELDYFEEIIKKTKYDSFKEVLLAHNIVLDKLDKREKELDDELLQIEEDIKVNSYCDKWDYIFAVSAGTLAGLIDSFFVGSPKDSKWINNADSVMDNLVQKFAKTNGWNGPKGDSDPTKSAIGFLERTFKVNYDHQHGSIVNDSMSMSASNHHLKSLAHSPSPIGLIFSLLDQFRGTASFIDNGQLITVTSESKLQGNNLPSKIFCAFVNWIGHIMSDIAGSSGASGRGSGIPIPFYELLQIFNFGSFDHNGEKKHFADIAVKVFENGYDLRFGMVLSIPVVMVELFIRVFCILRHRFQYQRSWADCMQFLNFDKNPRLRKMLLAGHGTLCLIDAGDAFIVGGVGNWVDFLSRMNFVAWMRFSYLGIRYSYSLLNTEISIQRYKLRAKAFDMYVEDVNLLVDNFLFEHNKKIERFFLERRTELNKLTTSFNEHIYENNYLSAISVAKEISSKYNISSGGLSLDDFVD